MRPIALLDTAYGRKLQYSGALLVVLSLCILSGFFIDLMQALALRSPIASMSDWLPVLAGIAIALLIPIGGACAGIPDDQRRLALQAEQSHRPLAGPGMLDRTGPILQGSRSAPRLPVRRR